MKPTFKNVLSCISALPLAVALSTTTPAMADSQFDHLRAYYTIDQHLPQTVVIKADTEHDSIRRVEFTFTAYDNEVVPARLEVPRSAVNPPVIILLHGITQSRHQWWRADNGPYSFPSRHRAALIDAGYAVLAIDARKHGDRISSTDFEDPGVYLQSGYFDAARKFAAESAIDVRSAIDALDQIEGIDAGEVGVVGFSLGAIIGYLATAVDARIDAGLFIGMPLLPVTTGEAASFTSPFAYAEGFAERKVGILAGTEDQMYSREGVDALVAQLPSGTQTYWVESGHDFPDDTAAISPLFFKDAF